MMCPVRRAGDEAEPTRDWDSWIDHAISEAQARGDFDDLPGAGKPLRIESNPLAPEWDSAFGILRNAGMAPYWMELDKEIRDDTDALTELRLRTARYLTEQRALYESAIAASPPPALQVSTKGRWRPFRRRGSEQLTTGPARLTPSLDDLEAVRQRARAEYLERAARLDAKIAEYHNALPRDLWRLQRARLSPTRAAHDFDAACPPLGSDPRSTMRREDAGSSGSDD